MISKSPECSSSKTTKVVVKVLANLATCQSNVVYQRGWTVKIAVLRGDPLYSSLVSPRELTTLVLITSASAPVSMYVSQFSDVPSGRCTAMAKLLSHVRVAFFPFAFGDDITLSEELTNVVARLSFDVLRLAGLAFERNDQCRSSLNLDHRLGISAGSNNSFSRGVSTFTVSKAASLLDPVP